MADGASRNRRIGLAALLVLLAVVLGIAVLWGPSDPDPDPADTVSPPLLPYRDPDATPDTAVERAAAPGRDRVAREAADAGGRPDSEAEKATDALVDSQYWRVADAAGARIPRGRLLIVGHEDVNLPMVVVSHGAGGGGYEVKPEFFEGLRLRATAPGCEEREVRAADFPDHVVRLRGTGRITGRVVDAGGRARANVDVTARADSLGDDWMPDTQHEGWRVSTGADGAFALENLPPGPLTLVALARATGSQPAERASLAGVAVSSDDVLLELDLWQLVSGRVLDANGEPMPRTNVTMRATNPDGTMGEVWSTSTDETGHFELEGVTPVNTLWAWSDNAPDLAMEVLHDVPPGGTQIDIRLMPGGTLAANVVDSEGNAFEPAGTFYVLDERGKVHNSSNVRNGRLETHALPLGRSFDLLVYGEVGWSGRIDGVSAGSRDLVVRLQKTEPIRGRVLRPDGSPARAGTLVRTQSIETGYRKRPGLMGSAKTDENGAFEITDIADMPALVWAHPAVDDSAVGPSASAVAASPGEELVLSMSQAVTAKGRVDVESQLRIRFVPASGAPWHIDTTTEPDGTFDAARLPAGSYTVMIIIPPNRMTVLGEVSAPFTGITLTRPGR